MTGLLSVEEIAAAIGEAQMPHVLLPAQIDAIATVLAQAIDTARPAWETEIEARALERAADEVHREARWQWEMGGRGRGEARTMHAYASGRSSLVEQILRDRAARCRRPATAEGSADSLESAQEGSQGRVEDYLCRLEELNDPVLNQRIAELRAAREGSQG